MNAETTGQIPTAVQQLLADPTFHNRVAQAHSRYILQRLRVEKQNWPNYDPELDDKLHYTAHYLLWHGLQLKASDGQGPIGDELIKQGAEILEYLYAQSDGRGTDEIRQLFNAALGYYIAGHYARAYVLMNDLSEQIVLTQELELLKRLFLKDLNGMRDLILSILSDNAFADTSIAAGLRADRISEDEAISRILHASLNRAFSFFIEFPKTGRRELLDRAVELAEQGINLAIKTRFVDWWWLFTCTRYLFREYDDNALWTRLAPLSGDDPNGQYVVPYIRANFRRQVPVVELWRSQNVALPYINEPERRSYCLKMPTSAGKTRVAELAILRFLLDHAHDPDAKCIYIAPYRSLAVEVEHTLKESFHPLGVRVSELYGGFELSPIERLLMDRTRIVVATPEKIDAFLRYNPEFAEQVRLAIIDEGHIISLTDRGLRFEMFLHRLVRRFGAKSVRIFFISAVLPNTEEFAQWITGNGASVIQDSWRPSRQILGELRWDGRSARIEYLEADHEELGHECFVPNFIVPIDPWLLKSIPRLTPFPQTIREVVAEAAVRFALLGMTMIFCARKRSAAPVARDVMLAIKVHQAIEEGQGRSFSLLLQEKDRSQLEECIQIAKDTVGADHEIIEFLRAGVLVHHADIPKPLRIKLEELARAGIVRLIIASTTLTQGVNLPIQTVIVHGLSHGYGQDLTPMSFWNICGRAGRGLVENEGQILFAVDLVKPDVHLNKAKERGLSQREIQRRTEYKRQKTIEREKEVRTQVIAGYRTYTVKSALRELLEMISDQWHNTHGSVDVAKLCQRLAENNMSWASEKQRPVIEQFLSWLDTELLALIEEAEPAQITPDFLQELIRNSLAVLQAGKSENADAQIAYIRDALFARVSYIHARAGTALQRKRYYQLGLPLDDCERIQKGEDALLKLFLLANWYETWDVNLRCDYLITISEILLTLRALHPKPNPVDSCWQPVLRMWLQGRNPNEIVQDPKVAANTDSPAAVSSYLDDVFSYKLPWGFNALHAYLAKLAEERGLSIPPVASYFSALIKYGVHDPVASCLLAFGVGPRTLALKLSAGYPGHLQDVSDVLLWFLHLSDDNLVHLGLESKQIEAVRHQQEQASRLQMTITPSGQQRLIEATVELNEATGEIRGGDILIIRSTPDDAPDGFSLYTLWGATVGTFQLREPLPDAWRESENVEVRVSNIEQLEGNRARFEIAVQEI